MRADVLIPVNEATDVAAARRVAQVAAEMAGFDERESGAVCLVVTEAAKNLVKHGGGGDLIVRDVSGPGSPLIEILALDRGRGMSNVGRCFADGYSTAGSPGTGLGAIARLSQFHDIFSSPDQGTVLVARMGQGKTEHAERLEIGAISLPHPGEDICGDQWALNVAPERIRLMVADGLGHGLFASAAAVKAVQTVDDVRSRNPSDVVESAHLALKSTRGAAVAVIDLNEAARTVTFAGVGNVAGAVVSEKGSRRQMVSINGTLGHEMRGARQYEYPLDPNGLVVMHSDGLTVHWSIDKYPGLFQRHPSVIAGVLLRDFRRTRDDATVVVIRPKSNSMAA